TYRACQHPFHEQSKAQTGEDTYIFRELSEVCLHETDGEALAVCVVCSSVLSNETMKPSKLQRHSKKTHAHLKEKKTFNISCLKSFEGQQTLMRQSAKVCELALKASYQVALRVAQTKQPYIIAESLILPTASDMCKTMFGKDEYVKKLKSIPMPALLMNWQLM